MLSLRYPITRFVYRPLSGPLASVLARTGVTPVQITWVSAVVAFAGAGVFAAGHYITGALLTFAGVVTDCVDGDLARLTGRTSRWGAFLDSVLDRWTDAALILGITYSDPEAYGVVGGFALVGSLLTSYTRARAESLGTDAPDGIGGRDARMLILVVAALASFIFWGLVAVAVLGIVTSLHRAAVARRSLIRLDKANEIR